ATIPPLAGALAGLSAMIRFDSQHPLVIRARDVVLSRPKTIPLDRIVAGSAEQRGIYVRQLHLPASKISVVHTAVDLTRFQPGTHRSETRAALGYADQAIVIGTMSRLTEHRKGV